MTACIWKDSDRAWQKTLLGFLLWLSQTLSQALGYLRVTPETSLGLLWAHWDHCVCLHRRRRHTYSQLGRECCSCRHDVSCPPSLTGRQAQAAAGHLSGQESARLRALTDKHWAIQLQEQRCNSSQMLLTLFSPCSAGLSSCLLDQQIKAHNLAKPHFCWQRSHACCWDSGLLEKLCQCRPRIALVSASQSGY